MRKSGYLQGLEAPENLEEGMEALFEIPENSVAKDQKKREESASQEKPQKSDSD